MKIQNSLSLQERARARIPGMTQLLSKRPDMFAPGYWPGYYTKAKGVEVWDVDGNRYVDMSIGGIGANVLGYADPDVNAAVMHAVLEGSCSSLNCPEEIELADLLCELHPWAEKVRYARSGGESMAIAVRIARAFTGKDKIAFCGYHGWHDWYLAANLSAENALDEHLLPGLSPRGVPRALAGSALPFRYNHIDDLKHIIVKAKNEIAAVVMEPIRSNQPQSGFLGDVREIATKIGAILVVDEISAGFRIATGGAHLVLDFEPDMAVFSKALGNGFPIAAIIGKGAVMEAAQDTFISSTMFTERVGPAAALATVKKFRELDASLHLIKVGQQVQRGWKELAEKHELDIHIGGISPLGHFSFNHPNSLSLKAFFVKLMLQRGFLASNLFYAMYAHTDQHVRNYLAAVDESFAEIKAGLSNGNLAEIFSGKPSSAGFKRLT